jgi:hypothetical protein
VLARASLSPHTPYCGPSSFGAEVPTFLFQVPNPGPKSEREPVVYAVEVIDTAFVFENGDDARKLGVHTALCRRRLNQLQIIFSRLTKRHINLEALFSGSNPFEEADGGQASSEDNEFANA